MEDLHDAVILKNSNEHIIVGISSNPNLFMGTSRLKEEISKQGAGLLNKLWSFWKSPATPSEKTEKTRVYITVNAAQTLHLQYKDVRRVKFDAASNLVMVSEEKGRVLLVDMKEMIVVRMWKGARDCYTTFCKMAGANYAMIFYLQRGLLELYRLRHGYKVFSKYIGKHLLFFDCFNPMVFSNNRKLYHLEFEEMFHKLSGDEEDFKRLYMEEFMIQDASAKEMYAMNEIVEYAQSNPEELKREYIKSRVKKITSHNFLHALYEKIFENSPNPEISLCVIQEILGKYSLKEEKMRESMDLMENRCRIIETYIELCNAQKREESKGEPGELEKWLTMYEYVLSHESVSLPEKPRRGKVSWRKFVHRAEKHEWNEDMGLIIMNSLKTSHSAFMKALKQFELPIEQVIAWFISWLTSMCNCTICDHSKCELWEICREKDNPVFSFLRTVANILEGSGSYSEWSEVLGKYAGESANKKRYLKQIVDYCLNCSNLLHVVIISNMLKKINTLNIEYFFATLEEGAKFYLLILSNMKDLVVSPFTFAQRISLYEFIARDQLTKQDIGKLTGAQVKSSDAAIAEFLKRDKLPFDLKLDEIFKSFEQYLKNLDINDDYFQANLTQSQVSNIDVRDQALKYYKDPVFILCKLTKTPELVTPLVTLERLWRHVQRWTGKDRDYLEELAEIRSEYLYLDNVALRVGVFVKMWKKAFAPELLRWILPLVKHKGFPESNTSKKSLSIIYELLAKFQEDVKELKKGIQNYVKSSKEIPKEAKAKEKFTKSILLALCSLSFKEEISSDKTSFADVKALHNKLYDPVLLDVKEILWEETGNYWRHCAYSKIEKEYVFTNAEDSKAPSKAPKADMFYKQAARLIKLAIGIFQAGQKINDSPKLKRLKHSKTQPIISKILNVDEKTLRNAILMSKEITKKTLEKVKQASLKVFNLRIEFLAKCMKLDPAKAFELCKNIGTDIDNILEYNIKEAVVEGDDKEVEGYVMQMQSTDALSELLINCLEGRVATYLKGKKKVDIELLQLPNLERYSKFDKEKPYSNVTAESIKRLLKLANKYVTPSYSIELSLREDDINKILLELPK